MEATFLAWLVAFKDSNAAKQALLLNHSCNPRIEHEYEYDNHSFTSGLTKSKQITLRNFLHVNCTPSKNTKAVCRILNPLLKSRLLTNQIQL